MVSNPVHEQYLNKIPDPIMQKFDELIEVYSDQYLVFDILYLEFIVKTGSPNMKIKGISMLFLV